MYTVFSVLIILGAILVILAVLLQPSKGDLSSTFGGISSQFGQVFGMHRAKNMLARITKIIAAIVFLLILLTNKFLIGKEETQQIKPVTQGAQIPQSQRNAMKAPPVKVPGQGQMPDQGQGQ